MEVENIERPIILASDYDIEREVLDTDTGNAQRLKDEYGNECRYCLQEKVWYVWSPKDGVWKKDPQDLLMQIRAKITFQKLRNEQHARVQEQEANIETFRHKLTKKLECRADESLTEDEQKNLRFYQSAMSLLDWYTTSENADRLKKAIEMLRSEPGIAVNTWQWDADQYLFNCKSGTFDLRESTVVREHRREDFCTMIAPVEFNVFADESERPLFEAFIRRIMPDEEKRRYLQRFFGLCLSGLADERAILLFLGTGANGKGTLIRILCSVLGEEGGYAAMAAMNSFLQARNLSADETRNDLVALIGKRFVAASESSKKSPPLNSALLKSFAGGDGSLRIRGNWESLRNFLPKGKLVLATNNEPKIDDDSDGMWHRIKKVWFDVQIPESEQDKDLVDRIMATESCAVLAWFLEGWAAYWEDRQAGRPGLPTPSSIAVDTETYRDGQSQVAAFIEACYRIVPLTHGRAESLANGIKASDLYTTYKNWVERVGERDKKSHKVVSLELEKWGQRHGVTVARRSDGVYWFGLQPIDADPPNDGDRTIFDAESV